MTTDETESQDNEKPLTEQESNVITFSWITRTGIYFGPPAYPLFHYTSLATFQKILESRKLWASHFRYLNDVTEFTYAVQVIVDRIEARQKESTYLQYAAKRVRNLKPTDLLTGPYVISFSENGDSLSQWRGYCSRMAGVSVGFSGGILSAQLSLMRNNIPGNETVYGYLVRCVYEREEQNARIDKLVDFLLESIKDGDIDDLALLLITRRSSQSFQL